MTSLHAIVPSAVRSAGHDLSSLFGASTIDGAAFANILAGITPNADPTQGDPLAQLTALIQNGTPLTKIVDQLSQNVGNALQQQLAGVLPKSEIDRIRSSITQSITNALAPPGNGPPGTPQQQAADLASRLRKLIETLARNATDNSGQLNELAGNILDAKSAKELPAQTSGKTASTLDVSSLVSSLLSGALSQLTGSPRELKGTPLQAPDQRTLKGDPLRRDTISYIPEQNTLAPPSLPSLGSSAGDRSAPSPSGQPSNLASLPPAITIQNAPDLLARMLVRAAGTDAKLNGVSALASGATAPQANGAQTTAGIAARLEALLASIGTNTAATAGSNGTSHGGGGTGNFLDQQFANSFSQASQATHDSPSLSSGIAVANAPLATQLQQLAQNAPVAPQHVDTTAIVEQLIKGMNMRTNAQGTSEIRLHLQPENLGDVTMKITVTGSQISANVVASNADVRNTLISNHQQLARSLADAGLTLSGFSVDVSGGHAGHDRRSDDRTAGFGRRYTVHELPGTQTTETPALASLGPPLLSGSSLALFNYLA